MRISSTGRARRFLAAAAFVCAGLFGGHGVSAATFTFNANPPSGCFFDTATCWIEVGGPPAPGDDAVFAGTSDLVFWDASTRDFWNANTGSPAPTVTNASALVTGTAVLRSNGIPGYANDAARTYTVTGNATVNNGSFTLGEAGSTPLIMDVQGRVVAEGGGSAGRWNVVAGSELNSNGADLDGGSFNNGNDVTGATVTGAGSRWNVTNVLRIGEIQNGRLVVEDGGEVDVSGFTAVGGGFGGGTGTVVVRNPGSQFSTDGLGLGAGGGSGSLVVVLDGTAITGDTNLGLDNGATGSIFLSEGGSSLTTGALTVGRFANGNVNIRTGASVTSSGAVLGEGNTGVGTVTVNGVSATDPADRSTWQVNGRLAVGEEGEGTLNVQAGGLVEAELGVVGTMTGATGDIVVTGTGSEFSVNQFSLGRAGGTGRLRIEAGGQVTRNSTLILDSTFIGELDGTGEATVTGTGSSWTAAALLVGEEGSGTLDILDGGLVTSVIGAIGDDPTGVGTATVVGGDGAGGRSTWNAGALTVGNSGDGSLFVRDGGLVTATSSTLGAVADSHSDGRVVVSGESGMGTPAQWQTGALTVGAAARGVVDVLAGGQVTSTSAVIAQGPTGLGRVTVEGGATAPSTWTSGALVVGQQGSGVLEVLSGATVSSTGATIGAEAGGVGVVRVAGAAVVPTSVGSADEPLVSPAGIPPGSQWNVGDLVVGGAGSGQLNVEQGGIVTTALATIGQTSNGAVTVTGTGSRLTIDGAEFVLGNAGSGTLNIADGGEVFSTNGPTSLGELPGGVGLAAVSGPGSNWFTAVLSVGSGARGDVLVEAGGRVQSTSGLVGFFPGGVGAVTVTGVGSAWGMSNSLQVGGALGSGRVDIADGGQVATHGNLVIGSGGTVRLNGGTLIADAIDPTSTGDLDLDAGTLELAASSLTVGVGSPLGPTLTTQANLRINNGDLIVTSGSVVSTTGDIEANNLTNAGTMTHLGGATVIDAGGVVTNQAGGQVTVIGTGPGKVQYGADIGTAVAGAPLVRIDNFGDLVLNDVDLIADLAAAVGSSLTVLGDVTLWGTLSGDTQIFGPGSTTILGGLNPGFSPGTLAVESDLGLAAEARAILEIGGAAPGTEYDQVSVGGILTLGGILDVRLLGDGGYRPGVGEEFSLFSAAAIVGELDALLLPHLGGGLDWELRREFNSLSLAVVSAVPLPAAVWLLLPALGGLLATRRPGASRARG